MSKHFIKKVTYFFIVFLFLTSSLKAVEPVKENLRETQMTLELLSYKDKFGTSAGVAMQHKYFFNKNLSLAFLVGLGISIDSPAPFILGTKLYWTPFETKKDSLYPYLGVGFAKAFVGDAMKYTMPAYDSNIGMLIAGIEGSFWIFNAHTEIASLGINERFGNKDAFLVSFAIGLGTFTF